MNHPLISVVIPTYNYAHFVTKAVESVLDQTYRHFEIILVDDGSTDDTPERLRPYEDRIRYVYQDNQGLSAARNTGIQTSRGDLVAFLDSDDLWHPRKLEFQVRCLAESPRICLVAADVVKGLQGEWADLESSSLPTRPVTLREMLIRSRFGPSSVLVRRHCFDIVGLFDTSLRSAEDRDMWIRILSHFPAVKLALPLWWYRQHAGNMSKAASRMEECEMKVLRQALDSIDTVRHDRLLRCKVLGYTSRSAAYRYDMAGMRIRAVHRVLRSLLLWPLPFQPDEAGTRFERPKMLLLFLLRILRDLCPEVGIS
jgi:glycosyltransferase involved in cell wall biosynthesis